MEWTQLLNAKRLGRRPPKDERGRTAFLRDYDKIIFSEAFRRLGRKTQVHPLATNDHVHNRLTHSLEVSCVGRTLGIRAGDRLQQRRLLPDGIDATDLGDIVQSACLAHDIGNPPFGHTGEHAIRVWFNNQGWEYIRHLPTSLQNDFTFFEGNAQGFHVITQTEYHLFDDGMRLTYATLGAFLKYPWLSNNQINGKYGIFAADKNIFEEVAENCDLLRLQDSRFARHPLAWLMEAADDFCYAIIDLEDGLEMNLLNWQEVHELLRPALPNSADVDQLLNTPMQDNRRAALLRGKVIEHFISAGVDAFIEHHDTLLAGHFQGDLISHCPDSVQQVVSNAKSLARRKIFEHPRKLELEIGAYEVINTLLSSLVAAAHSHATRTGNIRHKRIIDMMGQHHFPTGLDQMSNAERLYHCLLTAVGFLAGMTDNRAAHLARQFSGMADMRY